MINYRANVEAIIETNLPQIKDEVKEIMVNRIVELHCKSLFDAMREDLRSLVHEEYIPCTGGYTLRTLTEDQVMKTIDKYERKLYENNIISLSKMD